MYTYSYKSNLMKMLVKMYPLLKRLNCVLLRSLLKVHFNVHFQYLHSNYPEILKYEK